MRCAWDADASEEERGDDRGQDEHPQEGQERVAQDGGERELDVRCPFLLLDQDCARVARGCRERCHASGEGISRTDRGVALSRCGGAILKHVRSIVRRYVTIGGPRCCYLTLFHL